MAANLDTAGLKIGCVKPCWTQLPPLQMTQPLLQPAHSRPSNDHHMTVQAVADKAHAAKAQVVAATDLLALTVIQPPSTWGADICVGSAQRFGVPMGYGGPHAAFLACATEQKRLLPGRIIGVPWVLSRWSAVL